jgi:hypothetical protein
MPDLVFSKVRAANDVKNSTSIITKSWQKTKKSSCQGVIFSADFLVTAPPH